MSPARRKNNRRRGGAGNKNKTNDLWRPVPKLSDPEPIIPAADPTAVIRSLGDPPLQGQNKASAHYFAFVAERAAGLATALAATADLLEPVASDDDA